MVEVFLSAEALHRLADVVLVEAHDEWLDLTRGADITLLPSVL